jgi:thymidylate synthase
MYIEREYLKLLHDILTNGVKKQDRTGTGTISVFGRQIRHDMSLGFPLLTTKKMPFKTIVTELLWFLRGDTNIKFLVDTGCHIWDGDAYKNYTKLFTKDFHGPRYRQEQFIDLIKTNDAFARDFGDLGPIYGKQWRNWEQKVTNKLGAQSPMSYFTEIDQITNLIHDLKTNPDSRRLMVNAWNVGELDQMVLPPCHYGFQVYTRELSREERIENYNSKFENKIEVPFIKLNLGDAIENTIDMTLSQVNIPTRAISLMWNQRSVDTPLGLPFNIASYALLLEMLARETNMIADELVGNLGDCHIYLDQQDGVREQLTRSPMALGQLVMNDEFWNPDVSLFDQIAHIQPSDFYIENYESHPTIKFPLSN